MNSYFMIFWWEEQARTKSLCILRAVFVSAWAFTSFSAELCCYVFLGSAKLPTISFDFKKYYLQ